MPSAKQTVEVPPAADEWALTVENLRMWFLKPFEKARQPILDARKIMKEEGVSDKLIEQVTYYDEGSQERNYKEVLKLCVNPKTKKLWDLQTLSSAGRVSNSEISSIVSKHNGREPPYYIIHQIHRILDDRHTPPKEYLTAHLMFEGLCVGKREYVVNPEPDMRINASTSIGFYHSAPLEWNDVKDQYDKNNPSEEKRVATFNWRNWGSGDGSAKIYTIPWDRATFDKMMEHTDNGKVGLSVTRLSTNKSYGVKSIKEFCTDDLAGLIKTCDEPQPTYRFNIDPKALAEFMKFQQAKAEQGENHFQ